ncbi:TPA: hypothetical protein ACHFQM_004722 [Enterobacter hormaechei]
MATEINEDKQRSVERELQMLCALHGIGVLLLDPHDFCKRRLSTVWQILIFLRG